MGEERLLVSEIEEATIMEMISLLVSGLKVKKKKKIKKQKREKSKARTEERERERESWSVKCGGVEGKQHR